MELFLVLSAILYFVAIRSSRIDALSKGIIYCFVGYWHLNLLGAEISDVGLYDPSDGTVFLLWAAMTTFVIGFFLVKITQQRVNNLDKTYIENKINTLLKSRLVILALIAFAVYMGWCYQTFFVRLQMQGIVGNMRDEFFDSQSDLYGDSFNTIRLYVISPLLPVLHCLFCYSLLKRRNLICLIIFAGLFFYHSLGGGRFGYVYMIIDIIVVYLLFYSDKFNIKIKSKHILFSAVAVVCVLYLLSFVTSIRKGGFEGLNMESVNNGWEETSKDIGQYNFGPVVAFDQALQGESFITRAGGYTYGGLLFGPVLLVVRNVGHKFLGFDFEQPYIRVANAQQEHFIKIGKDRYWNALYTWNITFYTDFGLLGIFIFNLIIGIWLRSIIKMFYKKPSLSAFFLLCTLWQLVMWSVFNTTFNNIMLWALIIILYYTHRREKVRPRIVN